MFRSWWQKAKKPLEVFCIIVVCVLVIALLVVIALAYIFNVNVPGLRGKTLWDWLQLLIIPLALAVIALLFNLANSRTERQIAKQRYEQDQQIAKQRYEQDQQIAQQRYEQDQQIALDKQREDLLQAYLDRIAELLIEKQLGTSASEEVRNVARVRTITVLTQLDARRIGYVFAFLREAELMSVTKDDNAISLKNADLHAVDWSQADLRGADLRGVNLSGANLSGAIFSSIIYVPRAFGGTIVIPNRADLSGADLSGANLRGAQGITNEELEEQAKSLKGATMPDGKIHS